MGGVAHPAEPSHPNWAFMLFRIVAGQAEQLRPAEVTARRMGTSQLACPSVPVKTQPGKRVSCRSMRIPLPLVQRGFEA